MQGELSTRGPLTWLLQRITGLVLVFFLFTHIDFNHLIVDRLNGWHGLIDFQFVQSRLLSGSVFWGVFYALFIPSCVFHALNGMWGIVADYRPTAAGRKVTIGLLWLLGLALIYLGAATLVNLYRTSTGGGHGV